MKRTISLLALTCILAFGGCRNSADNTVENLQPAADYQDMLKKLVESERQLAKDVTISYEITENSASEAIIAVYLQNPNLKQIKSVRAWIGYPTHILEASSLDISEEFALTAPGETEFDEAQGVVKIGAAFAADWEAQEQTLIATITFAKLRTETATLTLFDPRGEEGHTKVLMDYEGNLRSVLSPDASAPFVIPQK